MATARDTFPLRFKRPHSRAALKQLAAAQNMTMTDVAERAIEHEIALLGLDMERRLQEALETVRSYNATDAGDQDASEAYLAAISEGEQSGLDPMRDITGDDRQTAVSASQPAELEDPYGVLAAFSRS